MSGTVRTISRAVAKADQVEALAQLLKELVELARAEAGCLRYELWRGQANLAEFIIIGEWRDSAAFDAHMQATYIDELVREIPEYVDHPPDVQWYSLVM